MSISIPGKIAFRPRKNSRLVVILLFILVTLLSYGAHATDRPITSALVYLIGVMAIGAMRGLRAGLIAAIIASLFYSGVIRNPGLQDSDISLEYYVPLFGFNFVALLSGTLAGRLKDRAEKAEEAHRKLNLLLDFSSKLQNAVRIDDVAQALCATASTALIRERIRPYVDAYVVEPQRSAVQRVVDLAIEAKTQETSTARPFNAEEIDLPAFIDLLSIAVDRCGLLEGRAENEARQQSERLKTTILSSISHDLRTPIAAITASAASLRLYGDALTAETRADMLATIEDQCRRLDQFTAKLLSFGRLQGGVAAFQFEPADVIELLGQAIASVRSVGPEHQVNKRWPETSVIVTANPAMLEQVFFNILENAFTYTAPGSEISVLVEIDEETTTVVIRDNGRGVSEESIGHIFEPFFRSGQSKHTHGQGLGLFIAKGFVEAFGGTIAACSPHDAGQGLEIAITLPLARQTVENGTDG